MTNGKNSTFLKISFKLILGCLFLALPFSGIAQYDYEHYVPPFYYGGSSNSVIGTHTVVLSTNSANNVKVYIETGNGTPYAGPFTIIRGAPVEYVFKTPEENDNEVGNIISYPEQYDFPYGVVGAKELNTPLMDQGLRFYSYDGPFFVNIRHSAEHHGGSLTTKGTYAKGTEFRSGHLYNYNFNEAYWGYYRNSQLQVRSHFISVMATEDNTEVNFSDIKCSYISEYLHGDAALNAKAVGPNDIIHVTLMKGQSYVLAVDFELSGFYDLGTNGWNGLNGTSITSTKPIVVNSGSWAVGADDSQDIGFDQIVPVDQLRDEYIVLRGKGEIASNEHPIVVATEDNTEIFINGDPVPHYTIAKKGDFAILDEFTHNINLKSLYINTKGKNIYVYQTLSGYKDRTNIGLNFIPPLSSTGMSEVTIPFADYLAKKELAEAVITILAQKNAVVKYQTTVNGVTSGFSTLTNSSDIPGNTEWVSYTIQGNVEGNYRFNSNKAINVAWVVYHDWLGAAGYYSGFTKAIPKIIPDLNTSLDTDLGVICESYDEQISVSVNEPLPDFYEWYVDEITGNPITSKGALVVDAPNEETTYYVVGYYMDTSLDFLFNGDFSDGTNRIKSDYDQVYGNLRYPGEFAISFDSKSENPIFEDFGSMDGNGMFMAYSKNQGDTIYKHLDFPVEEDNSYIIKLFGTLAVKDDVNYFDQSLKVLVNDEVIIENFNITKTGIDEWQSALGYWKSGTARDASISILNNNASGKESVFALDSITFAPAVQDTAAFVARVVPNYSYGNNGETVRFCQGTANSLDVSNGDTSWYDYSWSKKNESEVYDDLSDGTEFSGSKTHELIFANPQKVNEGEYRCTIGFKPEYQQCGSSESTVNVDLTVFVDEEATVSIEADRTSFCSGGSAVLNALVTGDYGGVEWYIDGGTSPVSLENPYTFNYPAGTYTVRCEAENGCGVSFDEVVINVLSTPELISISSNDNLCVGEDIIVTAQATGDGALVYTWGRDSEILSETGNVLNYPASILDRESTFKVKVKSVYTIAGGTVECVNGSGKAVYDLNIIPLVQFDQLLADATVCEGDNHTFSVDMKYPGDFYTYQWFKDGADQLNNLSDHILSVVDPAVDAGNYRVDVSNSCGSDFSTADLIVTHGIVVNDFSLDQSGPFCGPTNVTATFNVVNNGATYIYQVIEPGGSPIAITNPYTFTVDSGNQGEWEFLVSSDCDPAISFKRSLNMHSDFGTLSVDDIGTCIGENVTFEAKVSVIPVASDLHYAWTDNAGNPIGTDSDKLELLNVLDANFGTYSVTVTDDQCGNAKTATANLTKEAVFSPATATTPVCVGDSFSTTIAYIGSPTFEWRFNDPNSSTIIGTNETFSIANVSVTDGGIYYCTVKLVCKDVVIQSELKVNEHISLVNSGNEAVHICEGEEPILEVSVDGNADDYTIQWTDATDTDLGFEDVNHVQLTAHNTPGTYTYKAKVDGLCEDLEKLFIVTVHEKPELTIADNSLELCSGIVTIEVTETGEHNGIVWWKEGLEITDGNADDTNFVINPASSLVDNGTYIARVESDHCGSNQVSVNLDVRDAIVVTGQSPASPVVCENDATNLYVTATGDDIVYKWYKSTDTAITLSDQSNLDLGNISLSQAGEYKCELSNDLNCGNQTLTFTIQVKEHATVTNPVNITMCESDPNPVFTVTGTGEAPVTYQWYDKDDIAVTGATSNSLTVTAPVNGQSYYCVVSGSNSCKDATSNTASLSIIKNVTVTDPLDLTISDGANANFAVKASGEPDYTYQWQVKNGATWDNLSNNSNYSDVNQAKLQITGADKATFDGKQYRCVVGSTGLVCSASATSNFATLTITEVAKIAEQPMKTTICFNENASLSVEGASPGLTYTWYYKKGVGAYETADGKDGMSVSLSGNISTLTVPGTDLDINNWRFKCLVSDGVSTDQYSNEVLIQILEDITVSTTDATFTPCVNDVLSLSVNATGDNIRYKWNKVGDATILSTSSAYSLGTITLAKVGTYKCEIYNDLGCSNQVRNFVVDVKELPTVTNPIDVTMCANDVDPTFTVNGTGEGIVTYQWYDKDDNLLIGETNNTLTVTSPVNGQGYYAIASGDYCDDAVSDRATLTILDEVTVTDPVDVEVADGGTGIFSVVAYGTPDYTYEWQVLNGTWISLTNNTIYSGVDTPTLEVKANLTLDGKQYRCVVYSSVCSDVANSDFATLSVNTVIKIAKQLSDDEVCEGSDAIFVLEGAGVNPLTFTWQYHTGDNVWKAIEPAPAMVVSLVGKTSTLTVASTILAMNTWKFKCIVSDASSADNESNPVGVTVLENLVVTTLLNNSLAKCEGLPLSLSVIASGSDIKYKWYKDGAPATVLSTNNSYDFGTLQVSETGIYKCEISNACGLETVTYNVTAQKNATVSNPVDFEMCASDANPVFTVTGTAEGSLTYEWFDKDDISVGNTANLTVAAPVVHGQSYYCVVSGDACKSATSAIAKLTVYEEVSIVDNPLDNTIPDGGNATFTVDISGEPDYTYQWEENTGSVWNTLSNGGKYSGVTSATLSISGADQANFNGNQYRCIVGNTKCSANAISNMATLTITSVVKISGQPQNLEACLGGAVDFEITGKSPGLNYNWEYSTDGITFNTVTGVPELSVSSIANGSKLEIAATTLAMNNWTFRCIVGDGVSADETSSVTSLNVVEPINFDAIADENLCFGIEKQISLVNLSGTEPISFSWVKGGSEVSTTANVSIAAGDNGNYQVTASNGGVCPDKTDDFDVLHYSALSLDVWGNTDQVCNGQSETLTAGITSKDAALTETYQWYKDGSPIATTSSYDLVATNKNQSGNYKLEVSDGCSTKSVSGYVNVYEPIRATNTWDAGITLCLGEELKLETKVTGDVTSYTWTKDGIGITANSTYLKSSSDASDAGTYTCTVTGKCGTPLVYTIDVIVLEAPKIATGIDVIPAVCEGDPLQLGAVVVSGSYDEIVWTLNDNSENNTAGTTLDLGDAELLEEGNYKVTVGNSCGEDVSVGNQVINPIPELAPLNPQTVCQGDGVVFRANAVGRDLTYQWLVEGVDQLNNSPELILDASVVLSFDENTTKIYNVECKIVGGNGCGNDTESTTLTVIPNTVLQATLQNVVKYVGESHTMEVDITGSDLVFEWTHEVDGIKTILTGETGSKIEFTDISMADAGYYNCKIVGACGQRLASGKLTVKEPVSINSGLANFEEKCVGDPLSLSINATGQITSVKWFKDDVLLPNTELNFYIAALDLSDAAVYRCEIEGEGISVINESVTVRVYSQTVLNTPLEDKILCENTSIDWSPDVTGTSDLSYKWTIDGTEVHDQKILHYDALALNQEGDYEVQITSLCGDVTTSANLEIIQLPVFVSATEGDTVCENEPLVEFTVNYEGENLKYQWRKNGVAIPGKTTPAISLTSIQLDDEGDYNCRVYSICGEEFSPITTLTVIPQLKINSEPVDVEVCEGDEVLFTAEVVGNDVTYQWKLDGVDIPGEVGSSCAIVESSTDQSGYYTCIVSDICTDSRSTKPTELSVNALPNTEIFGRMVLCAKEDRVTYVTIDQPKTEYGWGVEGGLFAGPEEGVRTRITWQEIANGSLSVIISNLETGCKSQVDSLVKLNALPAVKLATISSKGECEGEFELTGGYPDGGIYWINGISETVFNPSDRGTGEYAVHYSYTDENGCSNVTSTTTLQVDVLPVVDITDDITVGSCIPTNLAADTDEDNIQWFQQQGNNWILPVDLDNPKSMTPTFTPGESQVLMARVQDEHGCEGVDLINLSVAPLPVVTTISDTTVSQCNQLQLITDIVGDEDVIVWTNPDHLDHSDIRSPKIIDASEGTYTYSISVTDLYGCDATDEVTVNMVADPKLGEDKFGCEGETFEVSISGMENPVWDDAYTNEQRTIETPGKYHLEVSNEFGCEDEQAFVINPTPDLGLKDTLIFEGQTVTLAPNLPSDYAPYFFEWQDGSILQRFEVSETGTYKLSVQDNLGCQAIDSAYVEVKPVGIESPNAFTPESNNDNSRFYLKDINVVKEFEMYVYDRWGELLFKSNETGYNGGWNGKYKGKLCPTGAYVWIAFINGEYTNKGTFVLVR